MKVEELLLKGPFGLRNSHLGPNFIRIYFFVNTRRCNITSASLLNNAASKNVQWFELRTLFLKNKILIHSLTTLKRVFRNKFECFTGNLKRILLN